MPSPVILLNVSGWRQGERELMKWFELKRSDITSSEYHSWEMAALGLVAVVHLLLKLLDLTLL